MVLGAPGRCAIALAIFVEGPSDREPHKHFLRELGHASIQDRIDARVVPQGDMLNAGTMQRHIQAVLHLHPDISHVLVLRDSESVATGRTRGRMRPAERELRRRFPDLGIDYVVVDHSIEGWLLCDTEALRAVLGPRARIDVQGNPDQHPRPAELMKRVFRENGKKFWKTRDNPRIAEAANVERIKECSETFAELAGLELR